jgi:putative transcriptional regulator
MLEKLPKNLAHHFLIATPTMDDPNFQQSVTYICEHNESGVLGIIINRPTTLQLADILTQMEIPVYNHDINDLLVLSGGPTHQEKGFVLHQPFGRWRSSFEAADGIVVTTSKDILSAIANEQCPSNILITLGYAGWNPGQLEKELLNSYWLVCPADPKILFETPCEERWTRAASLLGIDIFSMVGYIGHA